MAPFISKISSSVIGGISGIGGKKKTPKIVIPPGTAISEFVLFGGSGGTATTGTIAVPGAITQIVVAGTGAGGAGGSTITRAGGGAASNVRGNTFPASGITSLYYSVAGDAPSGTNGGDTFLKINGAGGSDLIRLVGGQSGNNPGAGGPAVGGGPNAVAGGNGAPSTPRYSTGSPGGTAPQPFGCGGGGGGGGDHNNGVPGYSGGSGGPSNTTPISGSLLTRKGVGPAPNTWSFFTGTNPGGGGGGPGPGSVGAVAPNGGSVAYSGGGIGGTTNGFTGSGGGGGAGAGIRFDDPSDPTNNTRSFGGGGGATGVLGNTGGAGGRGILVVQLLT